MEWDMGNEIRFDLLVLYPLILHIFSYIPLFATVSRDKKFHCLNIY